MFHTSLPRELEDVSDALLLSPKNSKSSTSPDPSALNAQIRRVESAQAALSRLTSSSPPSPPGKSGKVVTVVGKRGNVLSGHRIVDNAMAAKYPGANWEVKKANFHDYEDLKKTLHDLKSSRRALVEEVGSLRVRERDSREAVERLKEKRRFLADARLMKDFKVDLGVGEGGRDGWLNVEETPKNDHVSKQVRTLTLRLLNKEMVKSMSPLESLAESSISQAVSIEGRLSRRLASLSSFPVKAVQGVSEVKRHAIKLVEEKGELEKRREDVKREFNIRLTEARNERSRMSDVVRDSGEELWGLREDLRYWRQRLKLERVKVEPVKAAVERLKDEMEAKGMAEGIEGGWMGVVERAAFLIGCNMDVVKEGKLEGRDGGEATRFEDVVDKIRGSKMVGVMREHLWPNVKTTEEEIREVCDEEGVWYNEEEFGDSRFGEMDWRKILRKLKERREE
ncbi:hypothetical protein TrCOL_g7287 [Triparma columacea]|uniref:Uncharacterized protein n=1 Tax=Triparma columacea TaxID=722753 RepID=A0A9W7GNF6_9STRA|nr:hypothetical protein TrCOL_g7287 [Triparma columacea]